MARGTGSTSSLTSLRPAVSSSKPARRDVRIAQLVRFVDDLANTQIGSTFNQFADSDGDDRSPEAPAIRRANLVHYLTDRCDAPVVLVAEAAGWRGGRYSGLCLLCERQIDEATMSFRRTSRHPLGWSESSATVVQAAIRPWSGGVLLWNLVPTHPRIEGVAHSNRAPRRGELLDGAWWVDRLLGIVRPRHVGAIGRHAAAALGGGVPAVRHPSHGGALRCSAQLRLLLNGWLGEPA